MTPRAFARMFVAAASGRLVIYLLFRDHWSWQPPYHLVYLQPPDFFESTTNEYLVAHMPGYWTFLRLVRWTGADVYVAGPAVQTSLQLLAIAALTATVVRTAPPRRSYGGALLAFALGSDPWLCEAAIDLQPAAITSTLFILLVERTFAFASGVIGSHALPRPGPMVATAAAIGFVGTNFRSDFATYVVLLPVASGAIAFLIRAVTLRQAAAFALASSATALALVVVLLLPRALWLRARTGSLILTTNGGGGVLWYGLGEIANPWNIPNPETGDAAIEAFGRSQGYPHAFASARTAAFFSDTARKHMRERPLFVLELLAIRVHRATLGFPPAAMTLEGDYDTRPEIGALGRRLQAGATRLGLLFTREYGPWVVKLFGLRVLGTALVRLTVVAVVWYLVRREADPLLLLPFFAYAVAVSVFVVVKFSQRYVQPYYWLGWVAAYLLVAATSRGINPPSRRGWRWARG